MARAKLALMVAVVLLVVLVAESKPKVLPSETTQTEGQYHLDRAGGYGQGSLKRYQCAPQCSRRCLQTQYKKACLTFCNKCCAKCLCVPPGYYGNKGVCPCYNNWKTKRGGPKCP
uniref:Gibberellin-regulated protein 4 n=1 Tax=Anthurium amnicola TaxID=1678845 RepID=A0A1D1YB55_9ARAE